MKISYLTILAATGLFSAIAIASFSRYRKGSQRKDLQNEHKDKPEYMPRQDNTLVKTTVGKRDIEVNAVTTAESGLEGQKVRRVKSIDPMGSLCMNNVA